ncbi:adenosylmethionine--8-amino-7-oxononanoate transaminase [Alkanindiges sp. WGS2144]|uniref:adenosylmethionine--8-amino-7-oxononanoate transaminase n=1 Tax=Alkanindiges sp. WGS2144 TaxID=3366808 RepID=UPI00375374AB
MNMNPGNSPLWHPCTQMYQQDALPVPRIVKAKGAYLYLENGQPVLDGISSWWVNLHGHSHPSINAAIKEQLEQFEHVILAGFSHEPITQLATRLVELTPPALTRCFFADSGSAAVEIALKMSLQYWSQKAGHQSGQPERNTFISLKNGYHGETLGSLSVTDIPLFSRQYQPLLIQHLRAPSPDLNLKNTEQTEQEFLLQQFEKLKQLIEEHQQRICAIIVEPLVQGAAGMKMYPPVYLKWLRQLCDDYQIHLILDEIAVGFGRTGTLFAHEQADICPDFLCLSKGLTAGYLPMSCVVTSNEIYQAFYSPDVSRGFLHSHSFTGNPLAARAALASLDIFAGENTLQKNQLLIEQFAKNLQQLKQHSHVSNIRQTGMIAAFDIVQSSGQPYPAQQNIGRLIAMRALQQGLLIRPIGNHVYFIPPYCVTTAEIDRMFELTANAIEWAMAQPAPARFMTNVSLP